MSSSALWCRLRNERRTTERTPRHTGAFDTEHGARGEEGWVLYRRRQVSQEGRSVIRITFIGGDDFWEILQTWASDHSGGHGTTAQFIALAEEISGRQLDELFEVWLFTPGKPNVSGLTAARSAAAAPAAPVASRADREVARWLERSERLHELGHR
jgi:hypothetical protein